MFIIPTKTRFKSQTNESLGRPIISGSASKAELEAAAKRYGWTRRELSVKEIREMPSGECRYHEICNPEQYNAAFTFEENKRNNKQNMLGWNVKRMWDGKATEEENQKAFAAGDRFALTYSQFVRSESNAKAITSYMEQNNLDATQVRSYIEAFEFLVPQGKLVLSPKAAGIGSEETLTGEALKIYPRLYLLLQPNKVLTPEDKLSADEWFAQHPELHETRTPPIILQKQQVATATAKHFEQAKSGTAEGQAVRFTDMGGKDYSGYPTESEKFSFKAKVRSMSATELAQRCADDPVFKKALDELK